MRVYCRLFAILACPFLLAVSSQAQAVPPVATKTTVEEKGFTWTETYEGSGNTDGFITDINSTVGYIFDEHLIAPSDQATLAVLSGEVVVNQPYGQHIQEPPHCQAMLKRSYSRTCTFDLRTMLSE